MFYDMEKETTASSKYTLYLINPRQRYVNYYAQTELSRILKKKRFMVPLAIPTVAALTPEHYEVKIIDEEVMPLPEQLPDIVGITTLAATILRVYEIADHYRALGVKVVLGGAYASYMVDEALQHADAVVVGEAEDLWKKCLEDFESGNLQKVYQSASYCAFKQSPVPRWDLLQKDHFFQVGVQVSRGCPFNCEFCLVHELFGHKMRYRDLDNVIAELKTLPVRKVFFIDDNLTVNRKYAHELMKALKPLNIAWSCMASIDIANDDELLTAMADSGCFNILVGFESLNPESLNETNKKHNKSALIYEDAVRKIHAKGIHITASFAVGFDHDTPEEFDKIVEFTSKTGLSYINLNILGAPPGSELYKRLNEEGRWYGISPDYRSGLFPCMHYRRMSQSELFESYFKAIQRIYSWEVIAQKAAVLFDSGSFGDPYYDMERNVAFQARATGLIIRKFAFSRNRYKRKLFFHLLKLIFRKKVAIDKAASYILSMLSYHDHIRKMSAHLDEYRDIVKRHDQGSWEEICRAKEECVKEPA
jgi:radical SAM superfamily enzyme YgiQ (UPF0313 family)